MATRLIGVLNLTKWPFYLVNTISGSVINSDSATLGAGLYTKTGGGNGNYIMIPDATPLADYFTRDNTCVSGTVGAGFPFSVYFAKVSSESNTVHYELNGMNDPDTNAVPLPKTSEFDSAVLVIAETQTAIMVNMIPAPAGS
jgi:hypothetical protein